MEIPKVLSIDYGTVRVGLAISMHSLADPLKIIANDEDMIKNIVDICDESDVDQIVVGMSENEMAKKIEAFVLQLKKHTDLPISYMDETLSSHTVHQKLKTAKKSKRGGDIDHYAAAEFLQEWLDENY